VKKNLLRMWGNPKKIALTEAGSTMAEKIVQESIL
jgi:hypothetical protein